MLTRLVRTSTRSLRPLIRSTPISLNGRKMSLNQQVWYDQLNAPSPYISTSEALLPGYVPHGTYAKFNSPIDKSPNDDRSYRLILLKNGMEVLLIHDPLTDKAAAAMDVRVGHLNDPEDLQGLAHFCEHLMFMGTDKYPRENDYTEYLTQNSGASNAFTGMDNTCYYFDVHPTGLEGALDRFAQFFIAPIFDPSCTEREANAVNSENSKNLQSDMWRMFQLDKSTSSRKHSFWRFGTGNRETLYDAPMRNGVDVRGRLIDWHSKHYSANLMKLVVLSKDSLDDMAKSVVDKFSAAPTRTLAPPVFPGSPLGPNELGTAILVKSVKDRRTLELTFPFPDEALLYATKPGSFLSHLIGHEGQGSVLSYLKGKGWANGVSAGAGNGANGFEFFKVNIDLTREGLENHELVAATFFAYFDLLRATPPQEWAFREISSLSSTAFRFKEKSPATSTAMGLSLQMSRPYPRAQLLSGPYLTTEWNSAIIEYTINFLKVENCRIMISSQEELNGKCYERKEEWYGTEFTIEPFSEKLLKGIKLENYGELKLPEPNSFIPKNLEIQNKFEVQQSAKRPLSILNSPTGRLWYKKDDRWWVPRAGAFFLIRSPLIDNSPTNAVHSRFFTELLKDSLTEYSYNAELAGLSYTFDSQADGILLTIDGYNDKLAVLAKVILERIKGLMVQEKRFEVVLDQLRRAWINWELEQPYQHAAFGVMHLSQETSWLPATKLAVLPNVTCETLRAYIKEMLGRLHIETLVHGNMLKEEAIELAKLAETTLSPRPLTSEELRSHRALIIPEGTHLLRLPVGSVENVNSAIEQFTYIGDITHQKDRVALSLLGQMVQEPLFDQLRAKEQLGYIVSSGGRKSIGFMGLRVIVQSERDCAYLETRIDAFWKSYRTTLEEMSEVDFVKYKTTVANMKLEDHKNMWQESSHLWINIHAGYYDFLQKERDAAFVLTLTKQDLIDFFTRNFFVTPTNPIRRVSCHVQSQRIQPEILSSLAPEFVKLGVAVELEQMKLFAASKPTIPIIKEFAQKVLRANGKSEEVIKEYLEKVEKLNSPVVPEGVSLVLDQDAFRAGAVRAPYAEPVAEYHDLFPKL